MSDVIEMFPEPRRAERLMDAASDGGFEVYVQWSRFGTVLLFHIHGHCPATDAGMAAVKELDTRFKLNADFRDAVEHYCTQIGSAVHCVDEPAWVFRPVEATGA